MKSLILGLCLLLSNTSHAATFVSTHMGGYLGFTSLGLGVTSPEATYQGSAIIGYVPAFVGGEDLWSIALRGDAGFSPWNSNTRLYGGVGALFSLDKDTFILLPDQYPSGYYPSTGLLFAPYVGGEWLFSKNSSVYFELTTLDFYLELYVRNPDYLHIQDIVTYGIGYKYYLSGE